MRAIVTEVKQLNPDVFAAFSYPPDTLSITETARTLGFNARYLYCGGDRIPPF